MKNTHSRRVVVLCGAAACSEPDPSGSGLRVNELMLHNTETIQDPSGAWPDWVEVYNPTDQNVSLAGSFATDDRSDPLKHGFTLGAPVVPAGGFVILYADEDAEQGPAHLSFALDSDGGEDFALFGPVQEGLRLIDAVLDLPAADPDVAYARADDGTWWLTDHPTPGEDNER